MKKLTLLALSLVLISVLAVFWGCSNNPVQPVTGNMNDPQFLLVEQVVGADAIGAVDKSLDLSFVFLDSIPGSSFAKKSGVRQALGFGDGVVAVDSFNYSYANGWHSFQFWAWVADTAAGDTADVTGIDSLQVLNNGTPLIVPDSTVDELNIHNHYAVSVRNTNIAGNADHSVNVTGITPAMINPVTFNGSAAESAAGTFVDSNVTCDFSFNNSITATNVVISAAGSDCPTSGMINLSSAVDLFCTRQLQVGVDTLQVQGTWTASAVFNNGNVTATYTNGNTFWQFTRPCGSPVASPASRWMPGPR